MIKRVFIVLFLLVFMPLQINADAQTNAVTPTYKIVIDNKELNLSTPPYLHHGTTYISLRFVGTASGGSVEFYDGGLNVVWIVSAKQDQLLSAVISKGFCHISLY